MNRSITEGSFCQAKYPMFVIPVRKLMQMSKFLVHREMLQRGHLEEFTPQTKGKVIVVSHQWLSYIHPDPNQEHFFTLKRVLDRLGNGEVGRVEDYWLHTMLFRSVGITAKEWKNDFDNMYVWIDYCCIPQVEVDADPQTVHQSSLAVQSIAAYVERASLLMVLAPVCVHAETGRACNFASWRRRGWCRMEMMSALLSAGKVRVMVCTGAEATPFLLHPFEGPRLPVGDGEFSCCDLGHKLGGATLCCDKKRIRGVLEEMLQAKIASLKAEGLLVERNWYASMQQHFLRGLPEKEAFCLQTDESQCCSKLFQDGEEDVEQLHHFLQRRLSTRRGADALRRTLGWTSFDDQRALSTGCTLVMCAAIADCPLAVRELVEKDQRNTINIGLRKQYYHLAFMWKGVRPLGAAMAFASWDTVTTLLDCGADPKLKCSNGMDALFFACCIGNLPNIQGWLARFPVWDQERRIPIMGMNPFCAAACSGTNKGPVIRHLLEAGAQPEDPKRWGGRAAIVSLLANNEDSQIEALQVLLDSGVDVNQKWTPHTSLFAGVLKAVRVMGAAFPDRPLKELAVLEGSTPLHFAAKRGDVDMVKQLVLAGADVQIRNYQGKRPIDVARTFFGGQVPQALSEALLADPEALKSKDTVQLRYIPHGAAQPILQCAMLEQPEATRDADACGVGSGKLEASRPARKHFRFPFFEDSSISESSGEEILKCKTDTITSL
mmetsp:Transcript_27000/g.62833  ORF Transcript_27000/g.62833 Transcript_27000/m.62833 type:complete len:719 (+) Transcript_27000:106-2262(+)